MVGFIFGGNTGLSYDQLQQRRQTAEMLARKMLGDKPKTALEGAASVLTGIGIGIARNRTEKEIEKRTNEATASYNQFLDGLGGGGGASSGLAQSILSGQPYSGGSTAGQTAATGPAPDMSNNDVYSGFMDTVKAGGLTNPYGLAAVAATGKAESGFSPGNVNRTWSDPSESGKPGTAGGIMSWRGPRYERLAATGDLSPQGQARFFLQEDPNLVNALNNAQSVEEAQSLMNRAWAFKGYNRPGGEAARRLQTASAFLPTFQNGGGNQEVASLDPSIGMTEAAGAIERTAPGSGFVDPYVSAPNGTPQAGNIPTPMPRPDQMEAPQQVAQAPQQGQPFQPMQQPAMGPSRELLQQLGSPWLSEEQKATLRIVLQQQLQAQEQQQQEQIWRSRQDYERQQQMSDPARQLQMDYQRAQIDALKAKPQAQWQRLDDNTLFNPSTGDTRSVPIDPSNPSSDLGLNPQYGMDANGNPVLLQLGKNGQVVQSKMPEGVTLSKEPIKLDAGTHFVLLDPVTRQPVGQIPKNVAGEAQATVEGKAQGEARANLGQMEDTGNQVLSTIDSLTNDPYLDSMLGSVQGRLPNFSSDAARVQAKMDQIQGQQFLQAFNSLRGGGQITEVEGKKATDAIAALNTAQSETDYRKALAEFRGIVETGLNRARQKAGGAGPQMGGETYAPAGMEIPPPPTAAPASDPLAAARDAIARGAPREKVIERLRQGGINPEGL